MSRLYLILILSLFLNKSSAQFISIDSIVSPNQITEYKGQGLILLDFWATWCGPCYPATKQLEIIQNLFPNDVYIISISDESNHKIINYLKEKPIKLMVVSDISAINFNRYQISNRPYTVLMDTKGKILWQGKPGDLNHTKISTYFKSNPSKKSLSIGQILKEKPKQTTILQKDTVNYSIKDTTIEFPETVPNLYYGTLRNFISEFKSIPLSLIDSSLLTNKNYLIKFSSDFIAKNNRSNLVDTILRNLRITTTENNIEISVNQISIQNESMLWSDDQIEWEPGSPRYLIGEYRIEANSMTLKEIAYLLSKQKNEIYYYNGQNSTAFDWSFNYTIDKLMIEEFENSFGIKISPTKLKVKKYKFERSNP